MNLVAGGKYSHGTIGKWSTKQCPAALMITHKGKDTFIMRQRIWGERVTHQDVRNALNKYLDSGGRIVRLPDQKSEQLVVIGGEKYEEYESLTAILPS